MANRERRFVVTTITFVAIGYLALATLAATTLPWRGLADAGSHLNYVRHVHEGRLLDPYGSGFDEFHRGSPTSNQRRQYASAHPPGYYAAMAVLVGADLDGGHWERAVLKIRAVNIVLGLTGLVSMSMFGWLAGGRYRVRLAVSLPMVGTATFAYLRYSGEVYNDMAVTAVALMTLTLGARALLRGPTPLSTTALAILCAVGMGTKATFVVTLVVACAMVGLGVLLHGPHTPRAWARGVLAAAAVAIAALVSFAWFYERNRRLSGAWYRSTPKIPIGDRPKQGLGDVLMDLRFHLIIVERLVGNGAPHFTSTARWSSRVIALPAMALTAFVVARRQRIREMSPAALALVVLLIVHLLGHHALQLSHATGYGGLNWRYYLPATITIAAGLGFGAASAGRLSALLLPAIVASLGVANVVSMSTYSRPEAEFVSLGVLGALRDGTVANGLPGWLPSALILLAVVSIVCVVMQIWLHPQHFGVADRGEAPQTSPTGRRTATTH